MNDDGERGATRSDVMRTAAAGMLVGVSAAYIFATTGLWTPVETRAPTPRTAARATATSGGNHASNGTHAAGDATMTVVDPATPAAPSDAFREANARMHADMATTPTGDVDMDFARGMIPHHQGAVDMARIELAHGRDPEMRALATRVVETQRDEIDAMRAWEAKRKRR